jgi:hypothetical protein
MRNRFLAGWLPVSLVVARVMLCANSALAEPGLSAELASALAAEGSDAAQTALGQATERAVAAGANEELARSLIDHIDEQTLPTATVAAWLENTARLGEEGLPLNIVLDFYVQGVAKGFPVDRIETVVTAAEHRLREAATLVDAVAPSAGPRDPARLESIDHVAWALGLGVSKDELTRSLTLAREETKPLDAAGAPVLTLGILVASGLSTETSFDVVNAAWTKGYRGVPLERLGKALAEANPSGGAPPAQLVTEVMALLDRESSQDRFFEGLNEIMGREGYRLPSIGIEEDPLYRHDRGRLKDPIRSDNEKPSIGG